MRGCSYLRIFAFFCFHEYFVRYIWYSYLTNKEYIYIHTYIQGNRLSRNASLLVATQVQRCASAHNCTHTHSHINIHQSACICIWEGNRNVSGRRKCCCHCATVARQDILSDHYLSSLVPATAQTPIHIRCHCTHTHIHMTAFIYASIYLCYFKARIMCSSI